MFCLLDVSKDQWAESKAPISCGCYVQLSIPLSLLPFSVYLVSVFNSVITCFYPFLMWRPEETGCNCSISLRLSSSFSFYTSLLPSLANFFFIASEVEVSVIKIPVFSSKYMTKWKTESLSASIAEVVTD